MKHLLRWISSLYTEAVHRLNDDDERQLLPNEVIRLKRIDHTLLSKVSVCMYDGCCDFPAHH